MYTGSMCGVGPDIFTVWGYVISHTVNSQVELNPIYLAPILGMTAERVQGAIDFLCQPDERSRSPQDDGRRIVPEKGFAYRVPTHEMYRGLRNEEDRREYFRIKKAEQRHRDAEAASNGTAVKASSQKSKRLVKMSTHTEAEADTEAKAGSQGKKR